MPTAFATVSFDFSRAGRFGKRTRLIKIAEARNVSESRMNAAFVPNNPVTTPPMAAPVVNMIDHVTDAMAFAGSNSRSETMDGMAAVFAGSKKAENASCKTVSTYTSHI
jgi:hypothetical protein